MREKAGMIRTRKRLHEVTAMALLLAIGGMQPAFAAEGAAEVTGKRAEEGRPASPLPNDPGAPSAPVFPGMQTSSGNLQVTAPKSLHIVILDGEGALNNIKERTAREPIVQIEDENHKPVAGASVLFLIQNGDAGAGGTFGSAGSLSSYTTVSDAAGRAIGHGLLPNDKTGQYTIAVTASVGMIIARAVIAMSNISGEGGAPAAPANTVSRVVTTRHGLPKWTIIGGGIAIVAVAVIVTVLETNGSKGATITPGPGTITP